jgi:hypothetical protein
MKKRNREGSAFPDCYVSKDFATASTFANPELETPVAEAWVHQAAPQSHRCCISLLCSDQAHHSMLDAVAGNHAPIIKTR